MKKAILKTSGMLLVVGLALTAMLFGCRHKTEPTSKAETQTEKVTITILGDSNVKSIEPKTFTVDKGSKWGDIKGNVNVTYNEGYEAAGFKLENASGQDLTDDYAFNESKTVFAVSKQMVTTITVKGDERTDIPSGAFIKVDYAKTWQDIKSQAQGKVGLKVEWQGGDYAIYEWRLDGETGEKLTDDYKVKTDITVYAVTNYAKFPIIENKIVSPSSAGSGYTGGSPKGKIIIPENITSIGFRAFDGCTGLTSVDLSSCTSLTSIGGNAFSSCTGITSVSFPANLTSIGKSAFWKCTGLTSVDLSSCTSLTSIDYNAFWECTGLTSVSLSSCTSLTSIGSDAFAWCTGLTSVSLPASLTKIGSSAFSHCTSLTSATFADAAGWAVYNDYKYENRDSYIQQSDLANPATAARYLRVTYHIKYWKKN